MRSMKEILMRGMTKLMLSCDEATLLVTKSEFEKIPFFKGIQLKMHLFSCKLCRNFHDQSHYISEQIRLLTAIDEDNLTHHLSPEQKKNISETLEKQASID